MRHDVLVEELGLPKESITDGFDNKKRKETIHGFVLDGGLFVATGRVHAASESELELSKLAVEKDNRGNGRGRFLIQTMEAAAWTAYPQATSLAVDALPERVGFYEAVGFTEDRSSDLVVPDNVQDTMRMVKTR